MQAGGSHGVPVVAQPDAPAHAAIESVLESGRCAEVGESPSARVAPRRLIAPGLPPLLSFRYYEGKEHHRFGNTELVLDDAGH